MQTTMPARLARSRLGQALQGRQWQTRQQRRQEAASAARAAEATAERNAVADYVRTDDAARRRAIRLTSGSAYGAQHRRVAFRI